MLVGRDPHGAHRREADAGVVGGDDEVAVQREIGPTGQAVPLDLRDDRDGAVPDACPPVGQREHGRRRRLRSPSCWGKSPGSVSSAMKPYPDENDRPVLRMMITLAPGIGLRLRDGPRGSPGCSAGVSGLWWSGRFSVRRRTRPISSTVKVVKLAVTVRSSVRLRTRGGT